MSGPQKQPASPRPWSACAARYCQSGPNSLYRPALGKWVLQEDWEWVLADGTRTKVKRGFIYDMMSGPLLVHLIIPRYALGEIGVLLHDFFYRTKGDPPPEVGSVERPSFWLNGERLGNEFWPVTRKEADQILIDEARAEGVPEWKLRCAYAALRAFGWLAWGGRA